MSAALSSGHLMEAVSSFHTGCDGSGPRLRPVPSERVRSPSRTFIALL